MPSLFKKRLSCFYCGSRSAQSQPEPIRKWQCQQCLAVNYLDEHGEITDPPASEAASETRYMQYAQPIPRAASPEFSAPDSSLFCSTCLKNQHLLTQTLASYLPSPSHPDYSAYEASYPAYRKSLEERYPQVCESCEPQVRNRIRQVGYAAKSDHLRRMMEKSRHNRRAHGWSWRSMLVVAGAVCFWGSVAGQLGWNLIGAMAAGKPSQNLESDLSLSLVPFCFNRIWGRQPLFEECSSALTPYAGVALFLGMLSIWWNPKLRHKVEGKSGRLTGMGEYYKAQLIVLVIRFVAWACLQDPSITGLNPKLPPAIHGFMGIFTIISVVVLRRIIKVDTTPLVSWKDDIEPLVSPQKPKEDHSTQLQLVSPPDSQTSFLGSEPGLHRFPVNKLAPAASPAPDRYVPPSPQTETVDDADAMDWTPSQQSLQLNVTPKPIPVRQSQLPSAPKMPSLGSQNPSAVQSILKALGQKPNPFRNAPVLKPKLSASETSRAIPSPETIMAPPKFFPPSDFANDTGLESLFDKTFSIRDEPVDLQRQQWALRSGESPVRSSRILKCVLLSISIFLLLVAQVFGLPGNSVETAVLGISFLVAGFSLLESLMRPLAAWSAVDIILSVIELFACVYLAAYRHRGSYDEHKFHAAGKSLVAFMVGQEMMAFSFSPRKSEPSQQIPTEQPPQDETQLQPPSQPTQHQPQAYVGPHKRATAFPPSSQQKPIASAPYPNINLNVGLGGGSIAPSTPATTINNNSRLMNNFNYPAHQHHNTRTDQTHSPSQNYPPSISNDPTATHPAPYSSIPRPQPLVNSSFPSFPSFNSTLPDSLRFSPPSTATSTASISYASETASEPPSPQQKYASLPSLSPGRRIPSPGISGLTLEDDPWPEPEQQTQMQARVQAQARVLPRATRYALRSRRA
ncbi:hypothetical protein GX51_01537 [Blastomyces parvus]|uniref:Ima1 N-terminal domain-containing protein n=1 Tax=Blastomyces parvus TaxID=2060905 RepID=A0A2B7XGP5_9EURO|nr:hypothetical protein GX51_01537 [Blastomyces parvus]